MKQLLIICILLFNIELYAQNSLYVAFQPCDLGVGLRYDYQPKQLGLYSSIAYGNYRVNPKTYVNDHIKTSLGFLYEGYSLGINYHQFGKTVGKYPKNTFKPISFELGCKVFINRFCTALRFDPIKFEGTWDVGFSF